MKENLINIFNYSVRNQAGVLDIFIDGDIVDATTQQMLKDFWGDETSVSFKSFRNQVTEANPQVINVTVTSDGGHVGDAMAIYDFLQDMKAKGVTVNSKATGIVASAGTYPAMAGGKENSEITDNGWAMIHNVSGAVRGSVDVIENYAKTLRKFNDRIVDFYTDFTGQKKEDIVQWMNDETWMDAKTARSRGFFANKAVPAENYTRAIKIENCNYKNTSILEAYNKAVVQPINTNNENTMFEKFQQLFNSACESAGIKINNKGVAEGLTIENLTNAMSEAFNGLEPSITAAINTAVDEKVSAITDSVKNILNSDEFNASIGAEVAKNEAITKLTNDLKTANETIAAIQNDLVNKVPPAGGAGGNGGGQGGAGGAVVDEFPGIGTWEKSTSEDN